MDKIYVLKIWISSLSVTDAPHNTFYHRSWDGADALAQTLNFVRAKEWKAQGPWIYTRKTPGLFYEDHAEVRMEKVDG